MTITVECQEAAGGWLCTVSVGEGAGRSTHEVTVTAEALARYGAGLAAPADLVRASFVFLLEREPHEAILQRFELPVIERYFPEYPVEIAATLSEPTPVSKAQPRPQVGVARSVDGRSAAELTGEPVSDDAR